MTNNDTSIKYNDEYDERDIERALDPDADAVPLLDRLWNHQQVWIDGEPLTFVAAPPSMHAHSRRLRERDGAEGDQ